ncbi:MAG: hypothetical protein ACU837_09745 [Gammaproteobacteria bacterium]
MLKPHNAIGNKAKTAIKLGFITAGTQMGTALLHKIANRPLLVFGLGIAAGLYVQINRRPTCDTPRRPNNPAQ